MRSRPRIRVPRWTSALVLAAVAVTAGAAALAEDAAQTEREQREVRAAFVADVGELRRSLLVPAHDARDATAALRLNVAHLVRSSDREHEDLVERREDLLATLRSSADALEGSLPPPSLGADEQVDEAVRAPVQARLDGLDEQASWVARQLRRTADGVEAWAEPADELRRAADDLRSRELPDRDDPDALAAAWSEELEVLATYREAAEGARDHRDLRPLGEAHLRVAGELTEIAEDAVARLEDGDVDGYNALLDERLDGDDPLGTGEIDAATAEVLRGGVIDEVEEAQARVLGLLVELEELRRATPARSSL